jgi:hypothetical protein
MSSVCAFAAEQALLQSMPMANNATTTTGTENNEKYKLEDGNSTKQLDASSDLDSAAVCLCFRTMQLLQSQCHC